MLYYHGTPYNFREFDLNEAQNFKDFGRGIYLTHKESHATAIARKRNLEHAFVMVYDLNIEEMRNKLNIKEFKKVSEPWIRFVLKNRNEILKPEYDIVIGATADASAQQILEQFYRSHKNNEPSKKEYRDLIARLSVNTYPIQMCLLTQRAIDYVNTKYVETKTVY